LTLDIDCYTKECVIREPRPTRLARNLISAMAVHCYQYQEDSGDREDTLADALKERGSSSLSRALAQQVPSLPKLAVRHCDRADSLDPSALRSAFSKLCRSPRPPCLDHPQICPATTPAHSVLAGPIPTPKSHKSLLSQSSYT
jgi:hypothetical protein